MIAKKFSASSIKRPEVPLLGRGSDLDLAHLLILPT